MSENKNNKNGKKKSTSEADKKAIFAEKTRYYSLKLSAHKLKNRSSKNILKIAHLDRYNVYRHVSHSQLQEWANNGNFEASYELNRRDMRAIRRYNNKNK